MGIFSTAREVDEMARAFIGSFAFYRMNEDQQNAVTFRIVRMLTDSGRSGLSYDDVLNILNTSPAIVQGGLIANAMIEMGTDHGVPGFRWDYIRDPFALSKYSKRVLEKAVSKVMDYGINPEECFFK